MFSEMFLDLFAYLGPVCLKRVWRDAGPGLVAANHSKAHPPSETQTNHKRNSYVDLGFGFQMLLHIKDPFGSNGPGGLQILDTKAFKPNGSKFGDSQGL